jgi:hypothetical protein
MEIAVPLKKVYVIGEVEAKDFAYYPSHTHPLKFGCKRMLPHVTENAMVGAAHPSKTASIRWIFTG